MSELLTAFSLGNSAILTNVCMLPLYPGLIAFMAGSSGDRSRRPTAWLGVLVLAGVLSAMLAIGLTLVLVKAPFGSLLPALLPLTYAIVIALGSMLLFARNPFARIAVFQAPPVRAPLVRAYLYGLLLAPMTLPCTGPLVTSVFVLGAGSARDLVDGLAYFLAFGFGFGWPLVALPLIARPVQRRFIGWLTAHHALLTRASGALLIAIGLYGLFAEYLPALRMQ